MVGQPDAQRQFLTGIHMVADLLAPTLGPLGGHVAGSSNSNTRYELWDDAATAVRRLISLGRPQADVGAMLMRNTIWQMEQRVGDGGATVAVLARALSASGVRLLAAGINAMAVARGMRAAAEAARGAILAQARPVAGEDALSFLAYSATHQRELSTVLGEMRYLLGPDGPIQIDKLVAPYLERRYIAGAHFSAQIASLYFYTEPAQRVAVLAGPAVALVDEPLRTTEAALALVEAALARGAKSLLVVAPEVSGVALNLLVSNQQRPADKRPLAILACRLKAAPKDQSQQLMDLGVMTGAVQLGVGHGRSLQAARPEDLGLAERAEYAHDGLTLVAQESRRDAIRREAEALQGYLASVPLDDPDRPMLAQRLATLTGGVGELKIGAHSQLERAMLFDTATRGLKVLAQAQRTGVVAGGGGALVHAIPAVRALDLDDEARAGAAVVADALAAPLKQIARNAGVEHPAAIAARVAEAGPPATFDVYSGTMVDAHQAGVLDSAAVAAAALSGAVSCALMALTTDVIVYHRNPQQSFEP